MLYSGFDVGRRHEPAEGRCHRHEKKEVLLFSIFVELHTSRRDVDGLISP